MEVSLGKILATSLYIVKVAHQSRFLRGGPDQTWYKLVISPHGDKNVISN